MSNESTLTFEPTIYRDWSIIFSTLAFQAFTVEFSRQFGFRYTDTMYVWDGNVVTIYRAAEEHRQKMFEMLRTRLHRNHALIEEITSGTVRDMNTLQPFFLDILQRELSEVTSEDLGKLFATFCERVVEAFPRFAITMYFPQQVELFGLKNAYQKEFDLAVEARAKVHQVLTPIGNIVATKFADDALRRVDVPHDLARYLSTSELLQCWSGRIDTHKLTRDLAARKNYWMVSSEGVTTESIAQYIERHGWYLETPIIPQHHHMVGNSVYPAGKIIGTTRIVLNQSALEKIRKHDVVVAPMITPEYSAVLPLVKAIITDEGGVTSHAAILSREMKIPAVVGTCVASQVLHDGDHVKIDTETGKIFILEG